MTNRVIVRSSPSLALVKYWGKSRDGKPATSSLAVTLDGLFTTTEIVPAEEDAVMVGGELQAKARFEPVFDEIRRRLETDANFLVSSKNSFPTSAGVASSSSGFAAIAFGCARLLGSDASSDELSAIARVGSASAARSVFGGFTSLPAGGAAAHQLYGRRHWPSFRIVVATVTNEKKPISSSEAMKRARETSPFFDQWTDLSGRLFDRALNALSLREFGALGRTMRMSYLAMFSTMFTSDPPLLYWRPETVRLIRLCETLRGRGLDAWETIDAGPHVKIATDEAQVAEIEKAVEAEVPGATVTVCKVGEGPVLVSEGGQ